MITERQEILAYQDSIKSYRDLKNAINTAINKAVKEVIQKGLAEGIDVHTLSKMTGVSVEEIKQMQ